MRMNLASYAVCLFFRKGFVLVQYSGLFELLLMYTANLDIHPFLGTSMRYKKQCD